MAKLNLADLNSQLGTIKTLLTNSVTTNLPDNTTNQITPETLRAVFTALLNAIHDTDQLLDDIQDSFLNLTDGGEMDGNITFSGTQTVDGRDISVDGTRLDMITDANYLNDNVVVADIDDFQTEVDGRINTLRPEQGAITLAPITGTVATDINTIHTTLTNVLVALRAHNAIA